GMSSGGARRSNRPALSPFFDSARRAPRPPPKVSIGRCRYGLHPSRGARRITHSSRNTARASDNPASASRFALLASGTTDARHTKRLRKVLARALVDGRRLDVRNLGALCEAVEDQTAQLSHVPHGQVKKAIACAGHLEHGQRLRQRKNEAAKRVNGLTRLWP